jgi:hypothetical protein
MDVINETIDPARAHSALDDGAKDAADDVRLTQAARWRTPTVTAPASTGAARNPSLPTLVALFILILTFFIVLTSVSMKDQTKSQAAIASLQDAFSGNGVPVDGAPEEEDKTAEQNYIAGLTNRIQSLMPLMGGKRGPASDRQVLWLPINLVFAGEGDRLAPAFSSVLREIVSSLREVPQRLTPHLEMRLCAREPSDQLRARSVAIGSALQKERAPLAQFSIGTAQCDPKSVGIAIALTPAADQQTAGAEGQTP